MQIIQTIAELRRALNDQTSIALVPTMGNLHAGHLQLVNIAKQHAQCVVVSIFVNPLQFGANEDLANYPRTLDADCEKLRLAGANIVFAPNMAEIYADFDGENLNQSMTINPSAIANELCGASRPGHFAGVATIVLKLFNIVFANVAQAKIAVFGQKDFQQLFIIKQLVRQFNLPINIIAADTIRETNGLAMSSRNGYLSTEHLSQAYQLNNALQEIVSTLKHRTPDVVAVSFAELEQQAFNTLTAQGWLVDYIAIRSAITLAPATNSDQHLVVLGAAKLGTTRLIDNIVFTK